MQFVGLLTLMLIGALVLLVVLTAMLAYEAVRPPRRSTGYALGRGLPCDPSDLGLAFDEWSIDLPDGTMLPVWNISLDSASAAKPAKLTAVFIHGWGRSRIDMLSWIKPFDEFCDRLILYDLRAHGDASEGTSRLGSLEHLDLLTLLQRLDGERVLLVGHSMGAAIAMQAAASNDAIAKRIIGVVAYGPYVDFRISLRGRLHTHRYPTRPMTDLVMLWFRMRGIRHMSTLEAARAMTCPLLIFHGTEDSISPPDDANTIAEAARDTRLIEIEGAHHLNVRDVDPNLHDRAAKEFMLTIGCDDITATSPPAPVPQGERGKSSQS